MNRWDKIYWWVKPRIGPTFDKLEEIETRHPQTILPINLTLVTMLPAWFVFSAVVNAKRSK